MNKNWLVGACLVALAAYTPSVDAPGISVSRVGSYDSDDVIYLVTPDRFANGDPGNDKVEGYEDELDRSLELAPRSALLLEIAH